MTTLANNYPLPPSPEPSEMLMKEFKTAHSKMFSKRRAAQGEHSGENSPNRLDPNTESDHQTSSNGFARDRQQPEVERVRL